MNGWSHLAKWRYSDRTRKVIQIDVSGSSTEATEVLESSSQLSAPACKAIWFSYMAFKFEDKKQPLNIWALSEERWASD